MKDILNENDLVKMDHIKETIKKKDIRTHSQLKVELKKIGLTMDIKKNAQGKQQSYSITDRKDGKESLKMNSEIGKDRAVMQQFDDLIKDNREKAVENAREPKDPNEKKNAEFMEKANAHLKTNLEKEVEKRKSEIER